VQSAERDRIEQQKSDLLSEARKETLLEMHQRKRKLDEEGVDDGKGVATRRPFNRDVDMGVRGLGNQMNADEAKQKLGALGNRFAPSQNKKFL